MKIGDFANRFDISISAIRYYIKNGVLAPEQKDNSQFTFTEKDIREMEIILALKKLFFSINEIKQYLKVTRVYNDEDLSMVQHLIGLFEEKKAHLLADIDERQSSIDSIDMRIKTLNEMVTKTEKSGGIPIEFFSYLLCPRCGGYFSNEIRMEENKVTEGHLRCSCGYEAVIEGGIILAPPSSDYYQSDDFKVLHYQEIPPENADFVFFQYLDSLTEEIITLIHQTYNEISHRLESLYEDGSEKPNIIFVPDIASHYLYRSINEPFFYRCFKDSFIVVTGFSKENIRAIKSHMDTIAPQANIIYIANTICELPIKKDSLDLWIDAASSYNFAFFHPYSLHSKVSQYLRENAKVVGYTKYYDPSSRSLARIRSNYQQEMRNHSLLKFFEDTLQCDGFDIGYEKEMGFTTNPGSYYEYHAKGEKHHFLVYSASKR